MLSVRFEPTISAGERPQTYAPDRAATETGQELHYYAKIQILACNGLFSWEKAPSISATHMNFEGRVMDIIRCWSRILRDGK
jgi:hypothetical protein